MLTHLELMEDIMQLHDIMTTDVQLTDPGMTIRDAASLMRDGDFGLLPVGENDRLVGTVTDRDITVRAVADGKNPETTTVRDVMSEGIHYCFEDQDVDAAADTMSEAQIRRLPILDRDKRLVGIVALADLADATRAVGPAGSALGAISQS